MNTPRCLAAIDWKALRGQKLWLLEQPTEQASGLTHLIDNIQDWAVDSGNFTEEDIFGSILNEPTS